jgi:hypothetical protein
MNVLHERFAAPENAKINKEPASAWEAGFRKIIAATH